MELKLTVVLVLASVCMAHARYHALEGLRNHARHFARSNSAWGDNSADNSGGYSNGGSASYGGGNSEGSNSNYGNEGSTSYDGSYSGGSNNYGSEESSSYWGGYSDGGSGSYGNEGSTSYDGSYSGGSNNYGSDESSSYSGGYSGSNSDSGQSSDNYYQRTAQLRSNDEEDNFYIPYAGLLECIWDTGFKGDDGNIFVNTALVHQCLCEKSFLNGCYSGEDDKRRIKLERGTQRPSGNINVALRTNGDNSHIVPLLLVITCSDIAKAFYPYDDTIYVGTGPLLNCLCSYHYLGCGGDDNNDEGRRTLQKTRAAPQKSENKNVIAKDEDISNTVTNNEAKARELENIMHLLRGLEKLQNK